MSKSCWRLFSRHSMSMPPLYVALRFDAYNHSRGLTTSRTSIVPHVIGKCRSAWALEDVHRFVRFLRSRTVATNALMDIPTRQQFYVRAPAPRARWVLMGLHPSWAE